MSDADKPADQPQIPAQAPLQSPDARPEPKPGPPPNLDDDRFDPSRRLKELDAAAIERELQEAMGGLSDKDMYGESSARQRTQPPPQTDWQACMRGGALGADGEAVGNDIHGRTLVMNRTAVTLPGSSVPVCDPGHKRIDNATNRTLRLTNFSASE